MSLQFGSDISFSVIKVSILISSLCSFVWSNPQSQLSSSSIDLHVFDCQS
jgi:hypothetical protein